MMMNSWKSIKLSDVCYFSSYKIKVSSLSLDNYVSTENMLPNKSGICGAANLPNTSLTVAFNFGDILLSNIRPYFKKIWFANFDGGCSNDVLVLKVKESIDGKFLYYILSDNKFFDYDTANAKGTKMPRGDKAAIMNYVFPLPPLEIQKKIAGVLGALDDKIELNNKINANLEQQAQALFKSWFVDFEPFGGKMPDDWKVGKLGDFIEIKRGGSPRPIQEYLVPNGLNWLKISDATAETSPYILEIKEHIKPEGLNKTVFLKKGSLVLSNSATPGIPKFLDIDTCIHDGWLYFPNSLFSNEYLFLLFNHIRKDLISLGNGSVFTNLKTDILKNFEAILPTKEVLRRFDSIISSIFISIKYNREEIATLTTLRDMLLPKLMSGEIDVSNVDISELSSADKLSFTKE